MQRVEKHELEIEILPDGRVRVETHGVKGSDCLKYTEMLAKIVGRQESQKLKAEYYEAPPKVRIHQPQGRSESPGR